MPGAVASAAMLFAALVGAATPGSLRQKLRAAEQAANEDPDEGIERLAAALEAVQRETVIVANDRELHELRLLAQLALARALLAAGDDTRAEAAMDEALRSARKDPLPVATFGPALEALHAERSARLQERGRGSLAVECSIACTVYVNERRANPNLEPLIAGRYRVVVVSDGGDAPLWRTHVDVVTAGKVITLRYPGPAGTDVAGTLGSKREVEASSSPSGTHRTDRRAHARSTRRMLPRWLEIVSLTAGAGLLAGGTASLVIDERCADGSSDTSVCAEVWHTRNLGIGLLAAGGTLTLLSIIFLATDERRVRRTRLAFTGAGFRF